jgi:alkanesulfonate monooxygenase SsuD/methylene tetrahydromethanopterin reductase-like flavin-dependent oxidoreductase (luciferase family)
MFQDAGFPEAKEGQMSDRMVDALVIHGTAAQVKERIRAIPGIGAGELLAMPILPPDDRDTLARTLAVLGELARE